MIENRQPRMGASLSGYTGLCANFWGSFWDENSGNEAMECTSIANFLGLGSIFC